MGVPVLQNINWDPSAPLSMQTNSVHTDRCIYTASYAGKLTHTGVFIHSYTHWDIHTCCSQSWDTCDCSDNRSWATSGLTVRCVDCFPGAAPPSTHTGWRRCTQCCCTCAWWCHALISFLSPLNPVKAPHWPSTHQRWHLSWLNRRHNSGVWCQRMMGTENKNLSYCLYCSQDNREWSNLNMAKFALAPLYL